MLSKITLSAAVAASALVALPGAAQADHRDGYYGDRYERSYRGDRYDRGYSQSQSYYGRNQGYYGNNQGYYGRSQGYYGDRYYDDRRCSGTTGTIVGGIAGALLGRGIDRSGSGRYGRRDSGTTGAIIGGALGALGGRAIDKSSCRGR